MISTSAQCLTPSASASIFSCTTASGKTVLISRSADKITYQYGTPEKPDIRFTVDRYTVLEDTRLRQDQNPNSAILLKNNRNNFEILSEFEGAREINYIDVSNDNFLLTHTRCAPNIQLSYDALSASSVNSPSTMDTSVSDEPSPSTYEDTIEQDRPQTVNIDEKPSSIGSNASSARLDIKSKTSEDDEFLQNLGTAALVGIFILVAFYILPTIIAVLRGHPQKLAIAALNILLGWSFVGWVIALIWALTNSDSDRQTIIIQQGIHNGENDRPRR